MSVKYLPKDFKTILNKLKFIDSWFWCRYTLNPYNGCEFSCTYCDSRSHKYHLHSDFDQTIYVKTNVGTMLDNRISRARKLLPDVVGIGGTCDAYQPAEEKFENTKAVLEVLLKHHYPVFLSTKSSLILRDVDLLSQIADDTWCTVGVTITTLDKELACFLEPNVPDPAARLDIVRNLKLKAPQVQTGVHLIPIVPFLGDSPENLESIVSGAKESGADFILFSPGMTLRDRQAEWFMSRISIRFPDLVKQYEALYEGKYDPDAGYSGRYEPKGSYAVRINRQMISWCDKYSMKFRTRRFIPNDFRKWNYIIAERLFNESYKDQGLGKRWYSTFWAGQNIQNLNESIKDIAARGELQSIRNVDRALEDRIISMLGDGESDAVHHDSERDVDEKV